MHGDVVVPRGGVEPDSSAPFGLRKFVVDDCFHVFVAFEVANLGPSLTIEGARKVKLCYPLIMFPSATLSGYLGDELTLTTEVHLQELIFVIKTSAP